VDPKLQKNITDALDDLEDKLKPLQGLSSLSGNLEKVGGDLSAAARILEQSGKPLPDALSAFKRASDLLVEASTLIKNADPKVVADNLGQVDSSLKSMSTELRRVVEDRTDSVARAIDGAAGKIDAIAEDVSSFGQRLEDVKAQLSGDAAIHSDAISKSIGEFSVSITHEVRRAKTFALISCLVSFILCATIIGLLVTGSYS